MSAQPINAEEFCARIRLATNTDQVGGLLSEMYRAKSAGQVSDDDERRIDRAVERRRNELKATAAWRARESVIGSNRAKIGGGAQPLAAAAPTISMVRVPPWIGGRRRMLSAKEAKREYYLRRSVWHELLADAPVPALAPRVGMKIHDRLNAHPGGEKFGQCFMSLTTFSLQLRCGRASVIRSLKCLEAVGLIRIIRGGGPSNPNRYEPVIPEPPSQESQAIEQAAS
jgi:hypothetical protein